MKKLNKKGFTIVELVIVIAVIAILAGVLIPTFATVVEKANQSNAIQQAKNFYTLLEAATAAPTKYEMTSGSEGKTTYTLSMQKTGLVVSKTYTDPEQHADAEIMLIDILGDDVKTYYGAKVGLDNVTVTSFESNNEWKITAVYFQPKGSEYVVKIDLVAGTVGEAVKAQSIISDVRFVTFDGVAGN